METGDTRTEEADGATRHGAKVVRLPREWLGPREELVPIEPLHEPQADDHPILSASAFWSEESAALQGAVQGSATDAAVETNGTQAQAARPSRLIVAGPASRTASAPPSRSDRRLRQPRWAMIAAAAVALLVVAVIGSAEAPSGATPQARDVHHVVRSAARSDGPGASTANDEAVGLLASGHAGITGTVVRTRTHREHARSAGAGSRRTAASVRSDHHAAGSPSHSSSSVTAADASTGASSSGSSGLASSSGSSGAGSSSGSAGAASSTDSSGNSNSSASTTARRSDAATETLSPSAGSGLPAPGGLPPP